MSDPPIIPPTRRQARIARGEQAVIVLLALVLAAGIGYRAVSHWCVGADPIEAVPAIGGPAYRVNVNTADWETLSLVPGLGETLSRRIVEVREAIPGKQFRTLDELQEVRGIGAKTLDRLRPYLTISDAPEAAAEPVEMPARP